MDAEKAGGGKNHLGGNHARRVGFYSIRTPEAIGDQEKNKPPAGVAGFESQHQRARRACPLEKFDSQHGIRNFGVPAPTSLFTSPKKALLP